MRQHLGTQVQFLAQPSGLRIQCCCSCGLGLSCSSDLIPDPGTPYAVGWPKTLQKTTTKKIFFVLLWPHLQHMEVPRLGVESELWLLAYTTATATPDPSHIWDLHHGSQQRWNLNPLSEARDRTCILMDASQICFR